MSRFALQKCSNLAQMLLANLLIARVMGSSGLLTTNLIRMKKYQIIYADPAWQVMAGSKQSRKEGDSQKSLPLTYPTMTLEEIKALNVKDIKAKDSVLFLWTINKYLEQSYAVARAWGFEPSTMLVWDKTPKRIGLGGTFTLANEYLLFCRSGTVKAKQRVKGNHWHLPREKHSRKPDFFRNLITETFGDLDRIELFARERHEGWDAWGNEVEGSVDLEQYRSYFP
jgi:N6-adenosine-specific RNA methylase IME4